MVRKGLSVSKLCPCRILSNSSSSNNLHNTTARTNSRALIPISICQRLHTEMACQAVCCLLDPIQTTALITLILVSPQTQIPIDLRHSNSSSSNSGSQSQNSWLRIFSPLPLLVLTCHVNTDSFTHSQSLVNTHQRARIGADLFTPTLRHYFVTFTSGYVI